MNCDEGSKGLHRFTRLENMIVFVFHRYTRVACIGHRHRQRDQFRSAFQVTYREPDVASPDIHHGRAAAVIGRVHAHEVLLAESPA